ncbi:DNA-binding transcriptional regulator, HxlR family [Mycolicibacterium rutilum]|uniref:DNA-binding transcriptional regulator, HxlR family n=1 Tax=Mycolicibacterium rutilum TaxID=370526 RepID=A0A1H6KNH4_MYCRU|nr:helix-turn-helix domain-containing protein [Mycolicibacterium rutilum]SEH76965.1 DNA-binding transcriptional regulator, HxlR family [Mycolicibacterium rutilum]
MRTDPWSDDPCPIARAMAVIGQRWSMLIIREAFLGRTRFSEFKKQLGIASDILSARLAELVSAGVLETVEYREPGDRARSCYELTQSGRDLVVVLGAIGQWGYKHADRSKGTPYHFIDVDGEPVIAGFRRRDGAVARSSDVRLVGIADSDSQ